MTIEEIQNAIESLQHKDRLDAEDLKRLNELSAKLHFEVKQMNRELEVEEKFKNVYFEMAVMVNMLAKPNGTWRGRDTKRWHDLRNDVVDYILKRKIEADEKEGEDGERSNREIRAGENQQGRD